MYLKVQIPARFLIVQSDTVSDPIELGIIGTKSTQFTLMELNSTNAPWVQYSKNKDHIFKPADYTNTMPLFRFSDSAGNKNNKIRPNKFPRNFNMIKLNFNPLNPEKMSPNNIFNEANLPASDLPSNFKDSALNLELFQQQDGNALLDNYLDVKLKGAEAFMDWVSGQDDMFGFQNSGVLRKNDSNLNASRGGLVWSNAHLWHDDYLNLEGRKFMPSIMRPVEFNDYAFSDKNNSGYGLLSFNENALDVNFQQRMIADAPYNLSTVKFNTTQTHPVGLLYRYQSAINEDADKLRVASSGYRRYTEFKPPLLDWEGLGYPRLSQTKSSSELRRKPIQITFTKNRRWIMKPSLAEATEEQFASEIFSIKKLFHSNDKEFSTFDKTLLDSTSRLRSTKCYGLTDFKRKYYHNPETSVVIDEDNIWYETSKIEPKENLEIHTYGYAQYGYGLEYKMTRTEGLHLDPNQGFDYGGRTRYYDTAKGKKINAEPYWVRDNYRNEKPPSDVIGVNPSNGEYDRMRFIKDSGELRYIRNSPQILTPMTIETEMKEQKARNLITSYEIGVGGEIPTSTSPHWSAWKTSVTNVKGVKFKSDNFFKIFDYQTCFHNNLTHDNEHRHISQEIENLNYTIYGMHRLNPNKLIKKWWKKQVKDGKIDAQKDIPLYNIKVEDVRFSEGKKKMNGFKITYTIPYFHFVAFKDGNDNLEEAINPANANLLYPNYLKDLQTITGTTDRHGVLTLEITIALHPDKLGVSTFVKSDSLHSIELMSDEVRLIQFHIDDASIYEGMVNLVEVLKREATVKVGEANHFTRMTNKFDRLISDKTKRASIVMYDGTINLAGSDREKFSLQPLQTSMPSDFVKLDDCFMMYNYALQKGLLGREVVSTQHIRSGFTVSDPLSLPLTFKKGKVTPVGNFKYTYPLPYRRLNSYLTSTGEIFRPDDNLSTYNYISLNRYELPTGLAPLDLTKFIPSSNNDLDVTHGGLISLFTSTNYDTKKELEAVFWLNSGVMMDGLRVVGESEQKSLLESLKNLKKNRFTDTADKSLTIDYAKAVKDTLASKDLTKKEGTFIHFTSRKSDTDGKHKVNGKDKPNFEFRMQKVGGRLMKYGKDNQGYTRGKMPKDYTIFADLILPFAPRVLRVDEVGSDIGSSHKYWAMTLGTNRLQGVYNYQPQRRGSNYISDDVADYLQGVPSEWCPETYTYFGRTLGLFNWWGSLL